MRAEKSRKHDLPDFTEKLKICIIGGGYIGLPLAIAYAKKGIKVILYDIDKARINSLNNKIDFNNYVCLKDIFYFLHLC